MADARTVIRALVELEPGEVDGHRLSPEDGDWIAELFDGDSALFYELDNRPGRFASEFYHGVPGASTYDSGWHWKLRQARNDRRNHFFEILKRDAERSEP